MRALAIMTLSIAISAILGCNDSVQSRINNPGTPGGDLDPNSWLIPSNLVRDGGPGKDGIPALSNPNFIAADANQLINNNDLVIAIRVGDEVRVYPHGVLDWHEIINDKIGTAAFAITYCSLTGSGIAWNRNIDGIETTFGVSGLLYNTNLIPYDRASESYWSQMGMECVHGTKIGSQPATYRIVETTWGTLRSMFPDARIIDYNTGVYTSSAYTRYPYGSYRTNNDYLIFPVTNDDSRAPRKERVLGIMMGEETAAYKLDSFTPGVRAVNVMFAETPVVVVGSSERNFLVAYVRPLSKSGEPLNMNPVSDDPRAVMMDDEGTRWDVFGTALDGDDIGSTLGRTDQSYMAYWFAWAAFNPGTDLRVAETE
jgi:hypothetical protein